jgi:uncharacterized protein (DUF169 family)
VEKDQQIAKKVQLKMEQEDAKKSDFSGRLKEVLELDGSPVAVAFVPEIPPGIKKWQRRGTACVMIQRARQGSATYCLGENIICGGKIHLGLAESAGRDLEKFLIKTEKLAASEIAARRLLGLTKSRAPKKLGEYLVFAPLEEAPFTPEVVIFVGTPLQIGRIIWLDAFQTGQINTIHAEPLCSGVIATPISRNRIGISFMDMACRALGRYKPEELVIGVPYERLARITDSIEKSAAGTAKSNLILRLLPKLVKP